MHVHHATPDRPVVVIGAGPAGLTAAYELTRHGVPRRVIDTDCREGGIAQTVDCKGFRFDIEGHRFFTKVQTVVDLWRSMLGTDFLRRPRQSRICYDGTFFDYPLKPLNALTHPGLAPSASILASYFWRQLRPIRPEVSFEDWVTSRIGRRLYRTFSETYAEKVWGLPCRTISAERAAQRIKGLLLTTVLNMSPRWLRRRGDTVKTLIDDSNNRGLVRA
jgi:protoporphyrinogen oxidase